MKIYCYDRITRQFVGEAQADSDPMEPGKFLLPAFSTAAQPPAAPAGSIAVFSIGTGWVIEAIAEVVVAPASTAPTFAEKIVVWRTDVREHLNVVAVAYEFDSIEEAVGYAGEPAVPAYQILGAALRAWRSLVWMAFDTLVDEISGGAVAGPVDKADLIARLPVFAPPQISAVKPETTE